MGDREERAYGAPRSKLTEHAVCNLEVPFHHEVHKVMRKPWVKAGTLGHVQQ
jgi:hypothetical protein